MPMNVTPEQIEALFTRPNPDNHMCLHEFRIQPVALNIDGDNSRTYGYVARLMGHDADGKPIIIDVTTTEDVLQEMMNRMAQAGLAAAFASMLDVAADGNAADVSPGLLAILSLSDEIPEEKSL